MTSFDPRDPMYRDPARPGLDPLGPNTDPMLDPPRGNSWGLIGGLAALLVVVVVLASLSGGGSGQGDGARTPDTQTSAPAPAQQPAPDPTTTGSVPRQ